MTKNSKPKFMAVVKQDEMRIYRNGVISRRGCSRLVNITAFEEGNRVERSKGDIRAFSLKSRQRLREFLVKYEVPGAFPIGVTLTMPSRYSYIGHHSKQADKVDERSEEAAVNASNEIQLSNSEDMVSGFPETVRRFGINLQRAFPGSACVWRVELQTRGAPHLHCVLWLPGNESDYFDALLPEDYPRYGADTLRRFSVGPLHARICDCWCRAVQQTCDIEEGDLLKFWWGCGQDVQPLCNRSRYMRYCCDHLSKHKQAQLGYRGRQWAIIGRRRFALIPPLVVRERRALSVLRRTLGKIRRTKERKPDCIFGYRRRKYHSADSGTTICGEDTLRRLSDWLGIAPEPSIDDQESKADVPPINLRLPDFENDSNLGRFLWDDLSKKLVAESGRTAGSPFSHENGRRTGAAPATLS